MNELLSEVVDPKVYGQFDKLLELLGKSKISLAENVQEAIRLNNALGASRNMREFATNSERAATAINRTQQAQERTRIAEERLEQQRARASATRERQIQREEAAQARANARAAEAARPYNQLALALKNAEKEALDLGAAFGAQSTQFRDAARRVQELRTQVNALEQPIGRFQRNVGNYASGFNGLGNSINQLTREFPAFTFSVQTGFLALSNNLPIFFDQIAQTQREIRAMRAEGQQVPGLMRQLASSFFSFGTVMSIGITLLTVYGKEIGNFIGAIFKGTEALNQYTEKLKLLNSVNAEANRSAGEQISTLKILRAAAQDTTATYNERILAVRALQKEFPKTFQNLSDEIILNGKDAVATRELTKAILDQARARAAKNKLDEIEGKILDNSFKRSKIVNATNAKKRRAVDTNATDESGVAVVNISAEEQKKAINRRSKLQTDAIDKNTKFLEAERDFLIKYAGLQTTAKTIEDKILGSGGKDTSERDRLQRISDRLKAEVDAAKSIAENENRTFDEREAALQTFLSKSEDLIRNDQKIQLLEKDLTSHKIGAIEDQSIRDINASRADGYAIGNKILLDSLNEENKIRAIEAQKRIDAINEDEAFRLQLLKDAFDNGTISEQQLGELKLQIQHEYAQKIIAQEIDNVRELIMLGNLSTDERAKAEKDLAELKLKYAQEAAKGQKDISDKLTEDEKKNLKLREQAERQLADLKKQLGQELISLTTALFEGNFTRQEDEVRQQLNNIDIRSKKEAEAVNRSLDTEANKKDKLAIIEAHAQNQKEQLEARQRAIDVRRAQFEKVSSIAKIAAATAVAEVQALTYLSNPLTAGLYPVIAGIIAAVGAAQIATILATPIPKFEKGGKMPYTGLAEYGHGTELRINPDGKMSLTKSTPEVGVVKQGTQFISNKELMQIVAKPDKINYVGGQAVDISSLLLESKRSSKELKEAFLSHRKQSSRGISGHSTLDNAKWVSYIRKNLN